MAYAMKRNAGRPKQRTRRLKGKQSVHYRKGYNLGKRVGKGKTQKAIKKSIFAHIRSRGSAEEQRLLTESTAAGMDFRQGCRDAAGHLAGFNPSGGSDRDERIVERAYEERPARKSSSKRKSSGSSKRKRIKMPNGSFRYMVDGKFASKAAYDAAGRKSSSRKSSSRKSSSRKRDVSSMSWGDLRKKAGAKYKVGMTRVEVEEIVSMRANPRRNGTKKGMRRRTARRAYEKNPRNFGAEFLFI